MKKRQKWMACGAGLLIIALAMPSYGLSVKTAKGEFTLSERIEKKVKAGEKLVFKWSAWAPAAPFFDSVRDGVADAAKDFKVDAKVIGPADSVAEKQVAELETLIRAQQVDGIAVSGAEEDTLLPVINMAFDNRIPVIAANIDNPRSKRFLFLGQELYMSGWVA